MDETPDQVIPENSKLLQHAGDRATRDVLQEDVKVSQASVRSAVAHNMPGPKIEEHSSSGREKFNSVQRITQGGVVHNLHNVGLKHNAAAIVKKKSRSSQSHSFMPIDGQPSKESPHLQ